MNENDVRAAFASQTTQASSGRLDVFFGVATSADGRGAEGVDAPVVTIDVRVGHVTINNDCEHDVSDIYHELCEMGATSYRMSGSMPIFHPENIPL